MRHEEDSCVFNNTLQLENEQKLWEESVVVARLGGTRPATTEETICDAFRREFSARQSDVSGRRHYPEDFCHIPALVIITLIIEE